MPLYLVGRKICPTFSVRDVLRCDQSLADETPLVEVLWIRRVDQYQYNIVYGDAVAQLSAECKRGDQEGAYES